MVTNNKHVFALNAYKNEPERNIIVFFTIKNTQVLNDRYKFTGWIKKLNQIILLKAK